MAARIIASSNVSAVVPAGNRCRISERLPSSSSMVKPCTSDQLRAMKAACPATAIPWRSVPAGSRQPSRRGLRTRLRRLHAAPAANDRAARCCGTSARTCRDAPAQRRHRLLRSRSPFSSSVGAGSAGNLHRRVELPKADRGEFADEAGEIAEMMGRRGVRHAGLARHRAQCQAGRPSRSSTRSAAFSRASCRSP